MNCSPLHPLPTPQWQDQSAVDQRSGAVAIIDQGVGVNWQQIGDERDDAVAETFTHGRLPVEERISCVDLAGDGGRDQRGATFLEVARWRGSLRR